MKLPRSLGFFDSAGSRKHSPFAHPPVSAMLAGTAPPARKLFLSKLYSPAYASPVNASPACYQVSTHDSGSKRVANPSSSGTFIQYFMSVYPDAFAGSYNAWVATERRSKHSGRHIIQIKFQVSEAQLQAYRRCWYENGFPPLPTILIALPLRSGVPQRPPVLRVVMPLRR